MIKLAKISFIAIIFGGLGFSAAAYYLNITHPAWPFWIVLYSVSGALMFIHIKQLKLTTTDLYFVAFIGYVVVSFIIIGESSQLEFAQRILLICIAPYLSGRIIGKYAPFSLSGSLQVISFLYMLLIGLELSRNSILFQLDRLHLFVVELDITGGEPTAYNIGITFGATWVAAFASLIFTAQKQGVHMALVGKFRLLAIVLTFPLILVLIGSRTSVLAIVLCAIFLLVYASLISMRRKIVGLLLGVIALLLVAYNFIPEQRRLLINEIPNSIVGLNDYLTNIDVSSLTGSDGSVFTRVRYLIESWRLFLQSPFLGIGATNFGLRSSGIAVEFASPHSLFVQVLVEYGLVGASLLALMFLNIFRTFLLRMKTIDYYTRADTWGLFAVWVFVLIQLQFIGNLFYDFHLFLLTGLFVSGLKYGDRCMTQLSGDSIMVYKV